MSSGGSGRRSRRGSGCCATGSSIRPGSIRASRAAVGVELVDRLQLATIGDLAPDLTLILDVPVETAWRAAATAAANRFEHKGQAFHERVRDGFLQLAAAEPARCRVIDGARDVGRGRPRRAPARSRRASRSISALPAEAAHGDPGPRAARQSRACAARTLRCRRAAHRARLGPIAAWLAAQRSARHRQGDARLPLRARSAGRPGRRRDPALAVDPEHPVFRQVAQRQPSRSQGDRAAARPEDRQGQVRDPRRHGARRHRLAQHHRGARRPPHRGDRRRRDASTAMPPMRC